MPSMSRRLTAAPSKVGGLCHEFRVRCRVARGFRVRGFRVKGLRVQGLGFKVRGFRV